MEADDGEETLDALATFETFPLETTRRSGSRMTPARPPVRVGADALHAFVTALFRSYDLSPEDAATVADVLVAADVRGIDSHGSQRLYYYVTKLEGGWIDPGAVPAIVAQTGGGAVIDGRGGMGQPVSKFAMDHVIDTARERGAAFATVRRSNHYGIAGWYALRAVPHGMIGISMTNGSPLVAPTFGREKMLGANPIAVAVPTGGEPFCLDMSTSVVAAGKLQLAIGAGEPIPEGWALDAEGRSTIDPRTGLLGAMLPLGSDRPHGSHKGYGLAVVVDVLVALLSGADFGPRGGGFIEDLAKTSNVGHFFAALRVDAFRPLDEFAATMDDMLEALRRSALAPGAERIYVHGEPEVEAEARRRREGIPLDANTLDYVRKIAGERGLDDALARLEAGPGT